MVEGRSASAPEGRKDSAAGKLAAIVRWYLREVWGRHEGPGVLPFYCDPERVGHFAVAPRDLETGDDEALFRLFVALAMFQARRDVVIMRQQHSLPARVAGSLASLRSIARKARASPCQMLRTAEAFDSGCTVRKVGDSSDCLQRPGAACHVKDAAVAFNRMADLGKLPTSAWLQVWRDGGLPRMVREVVTAEPDPRVRAELLVAHLSMVRRVGRKLATMFVSTLSVPYLAPGLTPWYPRIDGNELVVVDTNVLRGVRVLRRSSTPICYDDCARWLRSKARRIDLRDLCAGLPRYSPRIVQQALYSFGSRSNRIARRDSCLRRHLPCADCVPGLCPVLRTRVGSTSGALQRGRGAFCP